MILSYWLGYHLQTLQSSRISVKHSYTGPPVRWVSAQPCLSEGSKSIHEKVGKLKSHKTKMVPFLSTIMSKEFLSCSRLSKSSYWACNKQQYTRRDLTWTVDSVYIPFQTMWSPFQNQNCLLATRPNDSHSPGPVIREVSPLSLQEKYT